MGIEPTSSAWKADILADVLYPQLQNALYHNFPQMSSLNLAGGKTVKVFAACPLCEERFRMAACALAMIRGMIIFYVCRTLRSSPNAFYDIKKHHTFLRSAFCSGGDYRDRTGDLLHAMQALSRTTHSRTPTQRCEDEQYSM